MNIDIYRTVVEIRALVTIPSYLNQSIVLDDFWLEDALGIEIRVSLKTTDSWAVVEGALGVRFRGKQGHSKVLTNDYVLQEHATKRDLPKPGPGKAQPCLVRG